MARIHRPLALRKVLILLLLPLFQVNCQDPNTYQQREAQSGLSDSDVQEQVLIEETLDLDTGKTNEEEHISHSYDERRTGYLREGSDLTPKDTVSSFSESNSDNSLSTAPNQVTNTRSRPITTPSSPVNSENAANDEIRELRTVNKQLQADRTALQGLVADLQATLRRKTVEISDYQQLVALYEQKYEAKTSDSSTQQSTFFSVLSETFSELGKRVRGDARFILGVIKPFVTSAIAAVGFTARYARPLLAPVVKPLEPFWKETLEPVLRGPIRQCQRMGKVIGRWTQRFMQHEDRHEGSTQKLV